jgi:hypothetical protein
MITTLSHAVLYAISFVAVLTMFVSIAGLVWWLCFTVLRALSRGKP